MPTTGFERTKDSFEMAPAVGVTVIVEADDSSETSSPPVVTYESTVKGEVCAAN